MKIKYTEAWLLTIGAVFVLSANLCHSDDAKKDELQTWSIQTHRIPFSYLEGGIPYRPVDPFGPVDPPFAPPGPFDLPRSSQPTGPFASFEDRDSLKPPSMLPETALAKEILPFISQNSEVVGRLLAGNNIHLPEGSLAIFDIETDTLAVRTTGAQHRLLSDLADNIRNKHSGMIGFQLDILEVDSVVAQTILEKTIEKVDHTSFLELLVESASNGSGQILESLLFDSKVRVRMTLDSITHREYGIEFELNKKGSSVVEKAIRPVGASIEISGPTLGFNKRIIDTMINFDYHLAPPTVRNIPVTVLGDKTVRVPATDFHIAKVNTNLQLIDGESRVLGTWQAKENNGNDKSDRQVIAFITGRVIPLLATESPLPERFLKEHGEKVIETPEVVPVTREEKLTAIYNRSFRFPSDHMDVLLNSKERRGDPLGRPIKDKSDPTARKTLEAEGVTFPPGAVVFGGRFNNTLTVANTEENLEKIEAYIKSLPDKRPNQIQFLLHVVQADGATLRKLDRVALGSPDHTPLWNTLQDEITAGRAGIVRTSWLETKTVLPADPERKATTSDITEYAFSESSYASNTEGIKIAEVILTNEELGFETEIDTVFVDAESSLIHLGLSMALDTSPPTERFHSPKSDQQSLRVHTNEVDFYKYNLNVQTTMLLGTKRMVGMWKPRTGKEQRQKDDVMQAVFIEGRLVDLD